MGKIDVFLGPMFSGKTTAIIRKVKELQSQGKKVKIFKPVQDGRYGEDVICSHDKISLKAHNIKDMEEVEFDGAHVIVIDEYFFFKDNLLDYCQEWKNQGKDVIIAGLDLSYMGRPINFKDSEKNSEDLKRIADNIHFLKSTCAVCGKEATMSERIAKSDNLRLVGGSEAYRPVCKEHHPTWKK